MQATLNDVRHEAADVVGEAARTAVEASRRTIEGMQAATAASRNYLEESSQLGRKLLAAWATGTEATLKAGFELQEAALSASHATVSAGVSILDTVATSYRAATQQWATMGRQAQEAALDAFYMNVRVLEKMALGVAASEATAK
jgi:hypothetical protein